MTTSIKSGPGNDTFFFSVSENAWQGDAQFVVRIDGVQQGDVQTATTLHSSGGSDTFSVQGTFGYGPHTAGVEFVN